MKKTQVLILIQHMKEKENFNEQFIALFMY